MSMAETESREKASSKQNVKCVHCKMELKSKRNLYKHVKRKHPEVAQASSIRKQKLQCTACQARCGTSNDLFEHYKKEHHIMLDMDTRHFSNEEEFIAWKTNEEKRTKAMFVQHHGAIKLVKGRRRQFYCHRSGKKKSRQRFLRRPRAKGSAKIDGDCPAFINVSIDNTSGECTVTYCLDHYGHECENEHLRLSEEVQLEVAGKLRDGATMDDVLSEIKQSKQDVCERDSMITRQDVYNISKRYNIELSEQQMATPRIRSCFRKEVNGVTTLEQLRNEFIASLQLVATEINKVTAVSRLREMQKHVDAALRCVQESGPSCSSPAAFHNYAAIRE